MREHLPRCLENGGEVILVFGKQAKSIFQGLLWENAVKDASRPSVVHQNVALDIEVVTPENSKLYAKTSRDTGICHLVIYAPHPCKFTPYNAGTEGRNDPVQKVHSAIRMDASLDYATRFIGRELPSQFFWRELAQRPFPVA
jgi:hypothetical protein